MDEQAYARIAIEPSRQHGRSVHTIHHVSEEAGFAYDEPSQHIRQFLIGIKLQRTHTFRAIRVGAWVSGSTKIAKNVEHAAKIKITQKTQRHPR
jgi:hypothetical protein